LQTIYASPAEYSAAIAKGPGAVFCSRRIEIFGVAGLPAELGRSYGSVMMIVLAIYHHAAGGSLHEVATSELLSDVSPVSETPTSAPSLPVFSVSFSF